jgi:hypothetical protein
MMYPHYFSVGDGRDALADRRSRPRLNGLSHSKSSAKLAGGIGFL